MIRPISGAGAASLSSLLLCALQTGRQLADPFCSSGPPRGPMRSVQGGARAPLEIRAIRGGK